MAKWGPGATAAYAGRACPPPHGPRSRRSPPARSCSARQRRCSSWRSSPPGCWPPTSASRSRPTRPSSASSWPASPSGRGRAGAWPTARLRVACSGPELIAGGLLAMATLPVVRLLGEAAEDGGAADLALLGLLGFFPPAAVLSAVVPTVVKLQLGDLEETGAVVGRLSALSTLGALCGTFGTGFVLVAALPNAPIVLGVGGALVLAGVVVTARLRAAAAAGAGALLLAERRHRRRQPVRRRERVLLRAGHRRSRAPGRPGAGARRPAPLLRGPRRPAASRVPLRAADRRRRRDAAAPRAARRRCTSAAAASPLPRYVEARRPGSRNVVLEVDREVVALARREARAAHGARAARARGRRAGVAARRARPRVRRRGGRRVRRAGRALAPDHPRVRRRRPPRAAPGGHLRRQPPRRAAAARSRGPRR